jgi:hypothetical protein
VFNRGLFLLFLSCFLSSVTSVYFSNLFQKVPIFPVLALGFTVIFILNFLRSPLALFSGIKKITHDLKGIGLYLLLNISVAVSWIIAFNLLKIFEPVLVSAFFGSAMYLKAILFPEKNLSSRVQALAYFALIVVAVFGSTSWQNSESKWLLGLGLLDSISTYIYGTIEDRLQKRGLSGSEILVNRIVLVTAVSYIWGFNDIGQVFAGGFELTGGIIAAFIGVTVIIASFQKGAALTSFHVAALFDSVVVAMTFAIQLFDLRFQPSFTVMIAVLGISLLPISSLLAFEYSKEIGT